MPNKSRLFKYSIGALIFLVTFIIYIKTLCPTVAPRDSSELITAAYTLGIAHPPGYPLYVMLGKLFALSPYGSIAWRVNLMSAFFASSTVTIVYFIILNLTRSALAGAVGSFLLGFSPIFWSLAVVAEVFQLNALFTALTIFLLLIWREKKDFRWLLLFSFIYGLSLTNHHTMFLLAPGFLYFVWVTEKEVLFKFKNWPYLGGCFALGLLPYIFLPLRSLQNPYLDWGDPQTLDRFIAVVTRRQFGSVRLDPALPQSAYTLEMIAANLKVYFGWLVNHFIAAGFLLGLAGAVINYAKDRKLFICFSLLFLLSGLFFVLMAAYPFHQAAFAPYCSTILRRFLLPSFLIFSIWIGLGAAGLQKYLPAQKYRWLVIILLALLPIVSLSLHYKKANMSKYYYAADLANNVLTSLKPNAIIFTNADTTLFSLWYLQGVEGLRSDVTIVSTTQHRWRAYQALDREPGLVGLRIKPGQDRKKVIRKKIEGYAGGKAFLEEVIRKNLGRRPLYSDLSRPPELNRFFRQMAPSGLIYKILPQGSKEAKLANLKANQQLWHKYIYRSKLSSADLKDYNTAEIITFYAEAHNYSGVVYAISGQHRKAKIEFEKALDIKSNYQPALVNLRKLNQLKIN